MERPSPWKTVWRATATALLVALVCASAPWGGAAVAASDDVDKKQSQLDHLKSQIEQTRKTLKSFRGKETDALKALQRTEDELENLRARIAKLDRDIRATAQQVAATEREIAKAEKELADATASLRKQFEDARQRIRIMYMHGPGSYLEVLLGSQDFADFISRYDYVLRIVQADMEVLDQLEREVAGIEDRKADIKAKRDSLVARRSSLDRMKADLAADEKALKEKLAEREVYLAQVRAQRQKWEKELAEEERQSKELEQTIRKLQEEAAKRGEPVAKWTGKFIWPVSGRITSPFGWRQHPIFQTRKFHSGLDIAVPTGTPVKAAADGKVIYSGWISGYGNTVIIDHGGGLSSLYAHNSRLTVGVGKWVRQGDIIAKAGSTGFSTGPHVHFEVRQNGEPTDPRGWLR